MTAKTTKAPKHLKAATRNWFETVLQDYELEPHHVRLLTLASEAWDRCVEAREAIKKHGLTFTNRYGEVKLRPEATIEKDSRIAFARLVRELNLTESGPEPPRPHPLRYGGR